MLGCRVRTIEQETAIAPIGSILVNDDMEVVPRPGFQGLSSSDSISLSSFIRFPYLTGANNLQDVLKVRGGLMELTSTIDQDMPSASWITRRTEGLVHVHSMRWPGMFGGVYIGDGRRFDSIALFA